MQHDDLVTNKRLCVDTSNLKALQQVVPVKVRNFKNVPSSSQLSSVVIVLESPSPC